MPGFFDTTIDFLKGVGPLRAELIGKELGIFTFADLIQFYPYRYEDRTKFYKIAELNETLPMIQTIGEIKSFQKVGSPRRQRLVVSFQDDTGQIDLVWFKGAQWIQKRLTIGVPYIVFGKVNRFGKSLNIAHPEIEVFTPGTNSGSHFHPVYSSTEKLRNKFIDSKAIARIQRALLQQALNHVRETLPHTLKDQFHLIDKKSAIANIHFPEDNSLLQKARYRLKFEELFYIQLQLLKLKVSRTEKFGGKIFDNSQRLNEFYEEHLPFALTEAQKRVIKEIYADLRSGNQMNRLVQGDVGSGKTIVAFLISLIALSNETQVAFMAPTEILSEQHFNTLIGYTQPMGIRVARLTGSTKASERKKLLEALELGVIHILVGTHALLEEKVKFQNLGLAVIDEQHRFGVAQRAKLWQKGQDLYPHVLVMTATPIPRTLAMTLYGDLDISIVNELPAGRKPVKTMHYRDSGRLKMFKFIEMEIKKGRQVYIVYPLIEESSTMDYKDLMDGYESISRRYPEVPISILHGKMKAEDKDWEMQRFVKGETKIMVATTVIEVGVDVSNASIMLIENAERFGLSQLHQLRGRVGRGADQSYCILMTGDKLTTDAKTRISTMVATTDGFLIAETDLKLRGPGDIMGTQQSGVLDLLISDLSVDGEILSLARQAALEVLREDQDLMKPPNQPIRAHLDSIKETAVNWGRIS